MPLLEAAIGVQELIVKMEDDRTLPSDAVDDNFRKRLSRFSIAARKELGTHIGREA